MEGCLMQRFEGYFSRKDLYLHDSVTDSFLQSLICLSMELIVYLGIC